jgi:type IV secretory pathway VirB10-like protein
MANNATFQPPGPWQPQTTGFRLPWVLLGTGAALGAVGLAGYLYVQHAFGTVEQRRPPELARNAAAALQGVQHAAVPPTAPVAEPDRVEALTRQLQQYMAQDAQRTEALQKELEALRQRPAARAPQGQTGQRPARRYATPVALSRELPAPAAGTTPRYTLAPGTWIPCTLETVVNSEIPGYFTVRTNTLVYDSETHTRVLIPQNQSVVAKAESGDLLFGNERIPTFALSLALPNGQSVDLGSAPILDQQGTNGLTGQVDNHTWRLLWTSLFSGGLRGGQQVAQMQLGQTGGAGPIAAGMTSGVSGAGQQRLGRAQDTRPTITVQAGDRCNILVVQALQVPAVP